MRTKYKDQIYDGRWQVVDVVRTKNNTSYLLENIYNHQHIKISAKTMAKIYRKETSVSYVLNQQLIQQKGGYIYGKRY